MTELSPWLQFVLAVLATWRITHLLAREDGPMEVLARLRARLGHGLFGKLMDCFNCLSLWVAAPIALLVCQRPWTLLLILPALSGSACLLERIGREPVVIEPLTQSSQETPGYAMLRTDTSEVEQRDSTPANAGAADTSEHRASVGGQLKRPEDSVG